MTAQKFKNTTTLMLMVLLTVSVYSSGIHSSVAQTDNAQTNNIPTTNGVSSVSQDCIDGMTQNMKAKYASFDEEQAKTAAINYDAFKSEVNGDKYTFRAVSQEWTNDQVNCDATLKNVLVLFFVTDAEEKQRDVTVLINPATYQPQSISVIHDVATHAGANATNWGGYAIKGNSTEATSKVYRATMNWIIPTPNDPLQLNCGTTGASQCDVSIWTGISKTEDGSADMAQVGTDSLCNNNNCSGGRQYSGWLETVTGGAISHCSNYTYAAGASMYGEVSNQKRTGGSVTKYDFYLINTSNGQTCSALSQTFGSTDPHYGLYMSERTKFSTPAHLPDFGTVSSIYGQIYYGGSTKIIYTPYNNGGSWFKLWSMANGGPYNESISGISPTNNFSIAFASATGT